MSKNLKRHVRYPKFPEGCSINSLVIRETDGPDELKASLMVQTRPESNMTAELMRISIVEVDGKAVQQPYIGLDEWNTKTRDLVLRAFHDLNDTTSAERADFFKAAEEATPGVTPPPPTTSESEENSESTEQS